jgi:acyl transferase domain-containing protein
VLKRLSDAQRDGDTIHAIIKGTAINNDGSAKIGFTAPSIDGQARVIAEALAVAEISADSISYVEAHGTGTSLGDPIEIAALTKAFRQTTQKIGACPIGSVKTNIGHLDAGAGAAGVIKTVLALQHRQLPPSLNFSSPNPQIDFASSPFFVNAQLSEWRANGTPRRAGISSFGIGGTNSHVIVEEAPEAEPSSTSRASQLLVLSAKTAAALDIATINLARHLRENPDISLADVAHTLQIGRQPFSQRRIVVASSVADAAEALEKKDARRVFTATAPSQPPQIAFMFPGQGAQFPGMARELFETEPVFREALLKCAQIFGPETDLIRAIYPPEEGAEALTQTALAQPAIFAVEYALAQLWRSWGIEPQAMLGHSVGEYVAACLAGVFSLEEALGLLAARARLMQDLPGGSMLAVRLSETDLRPHLSGSVELAAINSPRLCVVSGSHEAISAFEEQMQAAGVTCARLQTSHAFHSAMMQPIVEPFTALAEKLPMRAPQVPLFSTLTGSLDADFTRAEYWARQVREPVRFSAAAEAAGRDYLLLEVGPGSTLAALARQSGATAVVASLSTTRDRDQAAMLEALGRLWLAGIPIDWSVLREGEQRRRVPLPTYPFERQRFWIDAANVQPQLAGPAEAGVTSTSDAPVAETTHEPSPALTRLRELLHEMSGLPLERLTGSASLLDLGFDSLFLTQVALALQKSFGVKVAFRQLFEELSTLDALATFISARETPATPKQAAPAPAPSSVSSGNYGPFRPVQHESGDRLSAQQQQHIDALIARYEARTRRSKEYAQQHRAHFADPRGVSGFRKPWKEIVYQLVAQRSEGSGCGTSTGMNTSTSQWASGRICSATRRSSSPMR